MKNFKYLLTFICVFFIAISVKAYSIPEADVTYDTNNSWEGTLVIDTDKTVKIVDINHDNTGTSYGSPIKINNNSTVNLVFYGDSFLTANPTVVSAGIEVEEGSTVNIYGTDGSSLTVTGGNYGAGIGGIGYGAISATNPKAGNINIYGGTVKATASDFNFDTFDPYDLSTLYNNYNNAMSAGIGGGYGASSGNIVIEGNANVIAIGSCGGAGIGSGRGTPKTSNYDEEHFDLNITIRGNANVMAFATDDMRSNIIGKNGGAAIGMGRGTTIEGEPKGTIRIEENATIYAVASVHAQAIGESSAGAKFSRNTEGEVVEPTTGVLKTVNIAPTANVIAISDGYSNPISVTNNFIKLNYGVDYLNKIDDAFYPLLIDVFNTSNPNNNSSFSIQNKEPVTVMVQLANAENYNLQLPNYSGFYLANSVEEKMIDFKAGNAYEVNKYSDKLSAYGSVLTDFGDKSNYRSSSWNI